MNLNFTLVAQALTFAIFIWFTAKFIWPHLSRAIEARQQAQEILAQAENRASQIVEEAKAAAGAEGARLITGAKAEIEQEVSRARETLRSQVAALAVAGAEKILRREVDAKVHADLLASVESQL